MELKTGFAVDTDVSFLSSLLPPSSQWSCLLSLKVLSLQVQLALEKCRHDLQVLRYDNTNLAFHCHACLSAGASAATDQSKLQSARQKSVASEGVMGLERESCISDNVNSSTSLRLKPMASLMADSMSNCSKEVFLSDESDFKEPQEKSEDPVSPPRTAFMPISKQISQFPSTSYSSLSNAAGGTFNPYSRQQSLQPQAPGLYSNPSFFKSQGRQFVGPAPSSHATSLRPGSPPC